MITVDNKFYIGETVYLVTDGECLPRIVYSIIVTSRDVLYELACGTTVSKHYDFELTTSKPVIV